MITLFNRKKIMISSSMEDLGRFKMILSQSKIPFVIKTVRTRGTIGTMMDVRSYQQFNLAYTDAKTAAFIYYVYVHRRDYDRASVLV